jgi:hypothetical protein
VIVPTIRQARNLSETNETDSVVLKELWLNGCHSNQSLHDKTHIRVSLIVDSLKRMIEAGTIQLDGTQLSGTKSAERNAYAITEWGKFCFIRDTDLANPELSPILTEQFNREPVYGAFFRQELGEWLQDALEALSPLIDGHYPGNLRQAIVTQFFFMCIAGDHNDEAEKLMRDVEVRNVSREWLQEIRDRSSVLLEILEKIETAENPSIRIVAYQ